MGILQPMLRLAESKFLSPCTVGHESLFYHPVFDAISLFFPLSLSDGGDEQDIFHPPPTT